MTKRTIITQTIDPWAGTRFAGPVTQTVTVEDFGKAWCPECRRRVQIEDASDESYYTGSDEMTVWREALACGHENTTPPRRTGASPGGESLTEALADNALRARQANW